MASAQVVETSVNTNNSPSQDYTTNPDNHSNHNTLRVVSYSDINRFCPFEQTSSVVRHLGKVLLDLTTLNVLKAQILSCWAKINIMSLKAHANGCNKCKRLSTLLGIAGQQCCVHLHVPTSFTGFKKYMQQVPTSANIVVVPCKWTQQVISLLLPTILRPFAWALSKAFLTSIE